ncbi:hypothetical protein CDV36_016333, partial [Fusarium kuroshium]
MLVIIGHHHSHEKMEHPHHVERFLRTAENRCNGECVPWLEEMDIGFQKQASSGCYVGSDNPYGTRLAAEGDEHGHQRKTLVPDFSTRSIKVLSPIFSEKSLLLADPWQDGMKGKKLAAKPFEVLQWLSRATLGIIGKVGLGCNINSLEHHETPIRIAYRLMFPFDFWSHAFITDQDESRYGP